MTRPLLCALICSLFAWGTAHGRDDREVLLSTLEKARQSQDIRAQGMPGFELSGDVTIWVAKDKEMIGRYIYLWTPDGRWRQEIVFPGYKRVRSGDGKNYWQIRNTATEGLQAYELTRLASMDMPPKIKASDRLKRAHGKKASGKETNCIKRSTDAYAILTFCFDRDSGNLLEIVPEKDESPVPWRIQRREYSDYSKWQDKVYPRTIRGYNGEHLVTEIRFAEIKAFAGALPDFLAKPKDATVWLDCPAEEAWKLDDRVQPIYPSDARMAKIQGTVVLYAITEEDGHLSELSLANSANKSLDGAAAAAVTKWVYLRTDACAGARGKSEVMIDVTFSIRE